MIDRNASTRRWTRRRWSTVVAVLCALTDFACAPAPREAAAPVPPPRINFASSVHDFGAVGQGTAIDHTFAFTNRGGADLTIDKLRSGCGCDARIDVERVVQPGASAHVSVRCDTQQSYGRQRRTVSIYTNDPVTPVSLVRLVGTVRAEWTLAPSTFYAGRVHRGARVRRDGLLRWSPSTAEVVEVVAEAGAAFRVDVAVAPTAIDRGTFAVVINQDAPLGPFRSQAHLRDAQGRSLRAVAVVGEVVADVSASPPRIELGDGQTAAAVLIDNAGPRAVRVSAAEWSLGTATVDTVGQGKRYRVVLNPSKPGAAAASELLVRTDHPDQPLLRIPVVVR